MGNTAITATAGSKQQLEPMSTIAQRLIGEVGTRIPHEVEREQDRG
jgi:hypothetical protein